MTFYNDLNDSGVISLNKKAVNTLFSYISLLVYLKSSMKFLNPFSEQDGLRGRLFLRGHIEQSANTPVHSTSSEFQHRPKHLH